MAREMVLRFVAEGISARVLLLEDEAPRTCAALWRALPVSGEALHAAYSGTEIALLIDPSIEIEEENATECIQTGDVMYTHYRPRVRHGHPDAGSGIHWAYDRYVRPTTPGQWTPAISNVFGRIVGDASAFYDACRRMRREGAKVVEITASADRAGR
jgi:hypothetical protein